MALMDDRSAVRFALVTAAHRFVLTAAPFREPDSRTALDAFLRAASVFDIPEFELEAVLLRTLSVLDRYTGGRLSTLIDRYLSTARPGSTALERFREVVEDVLLYRGIDNPLVQRAIAIVEANLAKSGFGPRSLAKALTVHPATLARAFNAQMDLIRASI